MTNKDNPKRSQKEKSTAGTALILRITSVGVAGHAVGVPVGRSPDASKSTASSSLSAVKGGPSSSSKPSHPTSSTNNYPTSNSSPTTHAPLTSVSTLAPSASTSTVAPSNYSQDNA